ncbi:zinc finger B-box domain-containing protein 1 isoform X2 [Neopelma chrysocephalum]|uniref:zinc finger B-box domain-containing protein 1 isoform X2 n=1 Tax=Neopelma chrysocephalum TaxID=114329 RepID=UPI000FCCFD29|nr:zinc finger B-box domain-containing protein 1 isoform X2 [Neopelma chrysocephalum]
MNINDFVILPGSKTGTSVRLKTKTVRELQLEKEQLETENREMEKKLRQLQSNMSREKAERKKLSPYHWKSGQAGPMTIQARVLSQSKENWKKVSSGKVKLQILKDQIQEPVKEKFKPEMENSVAHKNSEVERVTCGLSEIKSVLLEPPSESTCTGPGNEDEGLLLNGSYNEEESAKSFQEALLQWRKGNSDHRDQVPASEVPSEPVGICEVQTSVTVLEEPVHVEFKQDGLSYMEKLLLKKYRRTPVDQIPDSCMTDLKPLQTLSVHQAVTGGAGEGDDDDMDDFSVEEMKRLWASLFKVEESNTTSASAESESSLKIEFLDDSHSTDLEESSNYLVVETGAEGTNKQGKTEALEQCGRNPVSSQEISQEKMVVCSPLEGNAVQKESIKPETGRSLGFWEALEEISNPTELKSSKHLETELQETREESQELGSVCNSHSLGLPVIKKSSPLQDVARRHKSVATWYRGLEGFFGAAANPRQGILGAPPSLCAASSPRDSSIPFPGGGQWVSERSLSDYAEDSVVQGVLERQLNKPSNVFRAQNRISPQMGVWRSGPGKHSSSTSEDGTFSLENIYGNTTDFHDNLELKEQDTVDIFGTWDESQMDEEEILEDKQQVLALQ